MSNLPTITLDTTITDLYKEASSKNAHKRIAQIFTGVNSQLKLADGFPRNTKYVYQDTPFNDLSKDELTEENTELQRSLAMKYLNLVPQKEAFFAGNCPVITFNVDHSERQVAHDKAEAEKTFESLDPGQKPRLIFFPSLEKIPVEEEGIGLFSYKVVLDGLDRYPLVIDLDTHYYLNTKAALARSGLPTPKAKIIETEGYRPEANGCCAACKSGDPFYTPTSCTGLRGKWITEEMDRVLSAISHHPLPFVVKNQQTYGGAGTFVIRTGEDRGHLLTKFSSGLLRKLLSQVNAENHYLRPGTTIISDLVRDPIGDYCLTFFVTDTGGFIFLAASEEMIDENFAWTGANITFTHQKALEEKFSDLIGQIAKWAHSHGYYGPVGADVLESRVDLGDGEPQTTEFNIVDLNVRTAGSLCLPLLRGHFQSRGFDCASSFSITVKETRMEFIEKWRSEFESGQMCILSWYEDIGGEASIGDVVIGAKDKERLQEEIRKVKEHSDDVTF